MAQISPLLTSALPVATSILGTSQRASQSGNELAFQREQAAIAREQEAARLAAEQQALERKYEEDRLARAAEAQALAAQRESEQRHQLQLQREQAALEREQAALARQQTAQTSAQAAAAEQAQRRREMEWLSRGQSQEHDQLGARQAAEEAALAADARARTETVTVQAEADERRRRDALRKAMGRTRASLAAGGVGTADGSGEAILLGLVADADAERTEARRTDTLKRQAIQQEVDNARRRNLLEQAQLAERQRLDFLSRYF